MDDAPTRIEDSGRLGAAGKPEGLVLGSLAFLPFVLAAVTIWLAPPVDAAAIVAPTAVWSGALLAFLAGVRRGLTFSEATPPRAREIASMLWLFGLAVVTLWLANTVLAVPVAIAGFASLAVLDFRAARRGEAPGYFAAFRPLQALVAVASLVVLLVALL